MAKKFKMFPSNSSSKLKLSIIGCVVLCATLLSTLAAQAKSIENLKSEGALEFDVGTPPREPKPLDSLAPTTRKPTQAPTTLGDIFDRLTSVFSATTRDKKFAHEFDIDKLATPSGENATGVGSVEDADNKIPLTTTTTNTDETGEEAEDEAEGGGGDESCKGLASTEKDAQGRPLTGAQRLLNLQTCMQAKVKRKLSGATRGGLELFEKLSLSGGCTASLMNLMTSMGELKGFAFKFLDASAKVPSGMMYGLLSDFGDFDQCLSIRSDPRVDPRDEEEERAYSGKYCLLNVRLKYHVQIAAAAEVNGSSPVVNSGAPEGIYPDGVLWDELVRNYWTTNSTKGFQVGVCVPSRCTADDLDQIYKLMAETYYFDGQVQTCQDSNDLRRQQTPDWLQLIIIHLFLFVLALNAVGSLVERYWPYCATEGQDHLGENKLSLLKAITCFSIQRNWHFFLRGHDPTRSVDSHQQAQVVRADCDMPPRAKTPLLHELTEVESPVSSGAPSEDYDSSFKDETESATSSTSGPSDGSVGQDEAGAEVVACQVKQAKCELATFQQLTVKILPAGERPDGEPKLSGGAAQPHKPDDLLNHLSGLKVLVIVWITAGHSFLYPSANNYQYYRSIINMNITRDSVWFATTNFTLGMDMLLYMTGLLFVYKLANVAKWVVVAPKSKRSERAHPSGLMVVRLISRRIMRFWPTYLSVIALAIVIPLTSDGPMWPEMVSARLGDTCRSHWWANFLMINNLFPESQVCLPSSWFLSVIMQCLLVGSFIMLAAHRHSLKLALMLLAGLLLLSSVLSFALAYLYQVGAPAIRMDETFVMELDGNIFRMYTNTLNNLGPFLVGMLGGFLLVRLRHKSMAKTTAPTSTSPSSRRDTQIRSLSRWMSQLNLAFAMALTAALVLSSVFFTHYTRFWAAIYWSCHRVGWSLVTGYLVHQCATNRWRLLKDLLSLHALLPLSRLIFIAYLVFPIFIHVHSGLVRDGLHVSIYNMLNIYITRLVMTFVTALALHLLIELPICSLEQHLLNAWLWHKHEKQRRLRYVNSLGAANAKDSASEEASRAGEKTMHPLLAVVPIVATPTCEHSHPVAPTTLKANR